MFFYILYNFLLITLKNLKEKINVYDLFRDNI